MWCGLWCCRSLSLAAANLSVRWISSQFGFGQAPARLTVEDGRKLKIAAVFYVRKRRVGRIEISKPFGTRREHARRRRPIVSFSCVFFLWFSARASLSLAVSSSQAIPDVRVVGFATPACADVGVSKLCEGLCTSVVLHDDVVPRVTPHAVRALLKDLLCTKVTDPLLVVITVM